jgi:hypothetical protein
VRRGGCNARTRANGCAGDYSGRQRNPWCRVDPELFPHMESSGLSVVRAAGIGARPDKELVALGGAAAERGRRFGGIAAERRRRERLRPLVGDYKNPILQPWAAEVVKKFGQKALAGITTPNPSNQCWPEPMPFVFKRFLVQIIQQPDKITFLYNGDNEVRQVRLNEPHQASERLSFHGDSVGHYEGDTLVIDTIGVRTDHPYGMVDLFGTPYTKALHVVERYSLRDYDDVKDAIERNKKENWLFAGDVFSNYRGKFLQLHLTTEDEGVFTMPWTATLTYVPGPDQFPEEVCAENLHQYYYHNDTDAPRADKPDF